MLRSDIKLIMVASIFSMMVISEPVFANNEHVFNAGQVRSLCSGTTDVSRMACHALLRGWSEGYEAAIQNAVGAVYSANDRFPSFEEWSMMARNLRGFCAPETLDTDQFVAIILKFLEENPETWHFASGKVLSDAMKQAFAC